MKVAIFDPFAGAGGDMIVACLLGVSLKKKDLEEVISSLNLNLDFEVEEVVVNGIRAKRVTVHETESAERRLDEVLAIIDSSQFDKGVKDDAKAIFKLMGEAESRVHGADVNEIVFHEVGCDDAIFDVVSSVIGIRRLMEEGYRLFSTTIRAGSGLVECLHGTLPAPAPATLEVLRRSELNVLMDGEGEMLTPTAAAILTHYCRKFRHPFSVDDVCYGAGSRGDVPNLLRLILGRAELHDEVVILETNVDDVSGEILGYAVTRLQDVRGVLDVFAVTGIGKKSRTSTLLRVVTSSTLAESVGREIMKLTGSLGVRVVPVHHRIISDRETAVRKVVVGGRSFNIRVKKSEHNLKPEFDDIVRISEELNAPLIEVYRKVLKVLEDDHTNGK